MRIRHDPVIDAEGAAAGRVLLTGANGYVGGRLLRRLEELGRPVRCMVRRPEALSGRTAEQTEIVRGDVLEPDSLDEALAGVTAAYYLVHSMAAPGLFAEADRRGAENFAAAARKCGVSRIVYLGGLGAEHDISTHLESRHEVGQILRESGVPTIECRASIIIGSGSISLEIVRSLVDRPPVMLIPRWVVSRAQPLAVEDVLAYLLAALDLGLEESRVFEIGGPDRVVYADLMREYARQAGLRRAMIRVPLATPRISGLWLSVVTPVYASIGRALIESLRHDTLVGDGSAAEAFPIRPRGFRQAIERALTNEDRDFAETRWSDALSAYPGRHWGGVTFGQQAVASRKITVAASPEQTFAAHPADRRHDRLVLRKRLLAAARSPRPDRRRRRPSPRTPGSHSAGGRRHTRLLAGGGHRAGSAPAPQSRDEEPGPDLAPNSNSTATKPERHCTRQPSSTPTASQDAPTGTRSTRSTT